MKRLEVRLAAGPGAAVPVGTLASDQGRVYFEYAPAYLATGRSLSPFRLPFRPGLQEHTDRAFGPLPGVFDDSLPDGWGRLLLDRHLQGRGLRLAEVDALDRLAFLGTSTMGALTYHPPAEPVPDDARIFDLHDLAAQAQAVLSGQATEVLPQLLRAGGSPAGARPKVLVGYCPGTGELRSGEGDLPDGFEPWLVKFASRSDGPASGGVELAYAALARAAGVEMPPTRGFETSAGERFFGVRRFDRQGQRRFHVHTFGNLIHADFRVPAGDYADLLRATSLLTRNHVEVTKAFRLAVFNVLAHNRDDHVKNFAFRLDDATGDWSLAPAYDLTFSEGPGGEHSLTVAGEGRRPGPQHLRALAARSGLAPREASAILDEVRAAVERWPEIAQASGVPEALAMDIAACLPSKNGAK